MQAVGVARVQNLTRDSLSASLAPTEYAYYFVIFYTVLGVPLGLVFMGGGIGAGFLMIPVLVLCVVAIGDSVLTVLRTAWIPIACGTSYLFVQLVWHGESLYGMYVYQFGPWLFSLFIVQALAMYRQNFLHRFAWFMLFVGLGMLPYMSMLEAGGYKRAALDPGIGFGTPNALAGWFGFCTVYLTIKGYVETRSFFRTASWVMGVSSLYILSLTTSRAALVSVAVSLMVASRWLMVKIGFFPILLFAGLVGGFVQLGVFDEAVHSYSLRAGEETGRFLAWPLLIEKFLNSPLIGVGTSYAGVMARTGKLITPHNPFLLIAVAAGVVPFALFCAYCFKSGLSALRMSGSGAPDGPFHLPLVLYTCLTMSSGNMDFMAPWAVVSLALPVAAIGSYVHQKRTRSF